MRSAFWIGFALIGAGGIVQRWQIVADGSINGAKTATVEVSATLESQPVPGIGYGVFATGQGCGALSFQGSSSNDSYDSSTYNPALGAVSAANGGLTQDRSDVGTNGNMGEAATRTCTASCTRRAPARARATTAAAGSPETR